MQKVGGKGQDAGGGNWTESGSDKWLNGEYRLIQKSPGRDAGDALRAQESNGICGEACLNHIS